MARRCVLLAFLFTAWASAAPATAAPATCADLITGFNDAVRDSRIDDAQRFVDRIVVDDACSGLMVAAQRRLSALRLGLAQNPLAAGAPATET
jgi:hypothetical protein